jgi:hypothetical protein
MKNNVVCNGKRLMEQKFSAFLEDGMKMKILSEIYSPLILSSGKTWTLEKFLLV